MYCPNTSSQEWKDLVKEVGEKEAWRNFFKYGEVRTTPDTGIYKSIATRSTEDIAEGIDRNLMRSQQEIKYTNHIQSLVLDGLGTISPSRVEKNTMTEAFSKAKAEFEKSLRNVNDFVNIINNEQAFDSLKQKDSDKFKALLSRFNLQGVTKFQELGKAIGQYQNIIDNFDRYKDFVKAELAHKGIIEVDGKIVVVQSEDVTNKQEDDTEDYQLAQEEIGERFGKDFNEVNPRETASLRVRSLVNNIKTGAYELGIPLYANPSDVFSDILTAGIDMQLSGYTEQSGKYDAFMTSIIKNVEARPYLSDLKAKIETFKNDGDWDTINQILTFASKAFANESLVLWKARRSGNEVQAITDVKSIGLNRDTIEEQVARDFYSQQMNSDFFTRTATGEMFPNQLRVEQLNLILEEGRTLSGPEKIKKFQDFFGVLGIKLTDTQMEYIAPRLGSEIKKGRTFDSLFAKKGMLENIYMGYANNLDVPFLSNYGLQNERNSLNKLAKLYYEANPGLINVPSSRNSEGKSKYANIQLNYVEIRKRAWDQGNTSSLMNSAFASPNKEFWSDVKNGNKTFTLGYFDGMREQEANKDGKTRKNLTDAEQTRAMFMKHQENMKTGTYILFTLSDKTASLEVKQTKEFFIDDPKIPVGKGTDFVLLANGDIEYTDDVKQRMFESFVAPEIGRIIASMQYADKVNLENFDVASKLFYIIPALNSSPLLESFRKDLYSGGQTLEELTKNHAKTVGAVILNQFTESTEQQIDEYISKGIIKNENGEYSFPSFKNGHRPTDYVYRFRQTEAKGRNLARLMLMDMKLNYMNAQVKALQFLRFDPMVSFKVAKDVEITSFDSLRGADKVKLAKATWDEFSKRAAALIAPGAQGNWSWQLSNGEKYFSKDYRAVTAADVTVRVNKVSNEITDAQEFTTLQEHIDFLHSEGKIPTPIWESINKKIKDAGPGGFYKLGAEETKFVFTPLKPVQVSDENEGENTGLNRIDYVKSSRYPLIPEHEANSERDKLRVWMEKNNIQSVNFASGKKLGRPGTSVQLFDEKGNFVEPSEEDMNKSLQVLSRDGLRTQQEIPHQRDEIATVSQMNRTLFDGLLEVDFDVKGLGVLKGRELKAIKEKVRTRMFGLKAAELDKKLGNLEASHEGLHDILKRIILEDTSGSYGENDLRAIELDPLTKKFKYPLELNFKAKKIQGLINSMINKNVMLKMDGSSFVQVSGVGAKFNFSSLSSGIKSGIIWTDSYASKFKDGEAKLNYITKKDGKVSPAQMIVSQYIKDSKGNLIDLSKFITEENGIKILDTSKIDKSLLELVGSRIPNQSLTSTMPIEVVGFLPSYMEDTIIVPDGITGQMGSDFDVDKLYAYKSKTEEIKDADGKIIGYKPISYSVNSIADIDGLNEDQLRQFYRDIHWNVLTNPETFKHITKSVDMPEVKEKNKQRAELLKKYDVADDAKIELPLDFNTSINRFNDNRSGKDGVSIYANLISAQADFQDKPLQLGYVNEGKNVANPILIKIGNEVVSFEYVGQTGTSVSFMDKKRSVSDNLNICFTESVDNAKNQMLRTFNWDKKAMSAVGILNMLTSKDKQSIPIEFSMDLASQNVIIDLFNSIDQKQDPFLEFTSDAFNKSVSELLYDLEKKIDEGGYLKNGMKAADHLVNEKREKEDPLSPKKLENMWIVGKMLKEKGALLDAKQAETESKDTSKLLKLSKDLGYKNINELLLDYYTTQFDSLSLFSRLNSLGTEFMTILGSVYTYTKGIGPDVFSTRQKQNQLNKLAGSGQFLGIKNIAGEVSKNEDGRISMIPEGEIGYAVYHSLIKAQDVYESMFPISTGSHLSKLVDSLLNDIGLSKDDLGRQRYVNTHDDVFKALKAYLFTTPELGLFTDLKATRSRLINGDTSLGKSILDLRQLPEFSRNGFLKNLEISEDFRNKAYTISFKAPYGTDIDEKAILSGFYELATSDNEVVREIARDLALYPFATGDAGNIGRFIPIDYYMADVDFKEAIGNLYDSYVTNMFSFSGKLKDQIVQNNPEDYSRKFTFQTSETPFGINNNTFKAQFKKLIGGADSLQNVSKFTIKLGDFQGENTDGIVKNLTVKLSDEERMLASKMKSGMDFKYPGYILINDKFVTAFGQGDTSVNYLYKRVSDPITSDGTAEYVRLNILGFKTIKEYDFSTTEPLKSVIKNNQVDVSNEDVTTDPENITYDNTQSFNQTEAEEKVESPTQPSTSVNPITKETSKIPSNEPKGEKIKEGVYVNQAALTKEEQLELFDYLKPFLEEQASKTNKGTNASKMIGLGLRWDYKNNNSGREAMNIPDVINEGNKNKYGYYNRSINGQELGQITPRFRELIEKATGIDMTNYDGAIINLYDNDSFISSHNDVDESKSALNYPVIGINIGGTGNFSIESRDGSPKQLNLQAGTGYIFGVDGTNRQVYHRTFPGKQDSFLPELTTKLDGKTYEPGSYRVTITMRRVMPLESGMPTAPARFKTPTIEQVEEQEDNAKPTVTKEYGAHTFIMEPNETGGFDIYYQRKGEKGALVTDSNLIQKVTLLQRAEENPDQVVTLNRANSPRYIVTDDGRILSLQDSSLGNEIKDAKIIQEVNNTLSDTIDQDLYDPETKVKEVVVPGEKKISVPEGSNENNMVIFEDDTTKFLMNDGQQEAFNFIKGNVERILKERTNVRAEDLENTVSFMDPLTQKFTGVIPKVMWDNMIGLAGRGGVGKTTVIRAIIKGLESTGNKYRRNDVMYLAPSHTAATVLQESLGLDSEKANDGKVNTIPSATRRNKIRYGSSELDMMTTEEYLEHIKYKKAFSVPDIIIVDESSMIKVQDIKDMLTRINTDLEEGVTNKMPIFIFMGDYRQLGPIKEQQNPDVNKGIISATLLLDKSKTRELTQVMRSSNKNLHAIYDAIGNQIIENIERTKKGEKAKQLSFDAYDKLTSKSSENILVVDNTVGVIDDYTDFLKDNNNPYGMFWVHYNNVENANTIALSDKIRKAYFAKIGKQIDSVPHRNFSNGDYVEFTDGVEMKASDFMYTPTSDEVKDLLDERKIDNTDGEYAIAGGVVKPRARFKVMDIVKTQTSLKELLPYTIAQYIDKSVMVDMEQILLYNRQDRLRGYSKVLDIAVDLGRYENKMQKGITIKQKSTGKVIATFDMHYGDFKTAKEDIKMLHDGKGKLPFTPSYIGSSHTAQGNSIKNVIVGDYNIKQNRAHPSVNQDDIFSSMYVAVTRTSGSLVIIKSPGSNISHNQEVFKGFISDNGQEVKPESSIIPGSQEVKSPSNNEVNSYAANEVVNPLELAMQYSATEYINKWVNSMFQGQKTITDIKGFLNRVYSNANAFNKQVITAIAKSGIVAPVTIVMDDKITDPGMYNGNTKTITINPKLAVGDALDGDAIRDKLHEVFMHEFMHHITAELLNAKPETLSVDQRKYVENINNLYDAVHNKMMMDPQHAAALQKAKDQMKTDGYLSASDKSLYYGLTSVHDFVSMIMTDQGFQDFMNNTTYDGEKSIFEKFMDLIGNLLKALGINVKDNSVLKEGLTNIVGLIQSRNSSEVATEQRSIAVAQEAKTKNINDNFADITRFLNIKTKC
jgi:alkylated DNA repair dioxygenase AlkB